MELQVLNAQGEATATVPAPETVFGREFNEALVHQLVVAYQANARSGNRAQKDRSEVRHTTKKPFRQKGTGRARAGYASSPVWRGGGVVFGPHPRDYSKQVNKKVKRLALRKVLSERIKSGDVLVTESFSVAAPKTKEFLALLKSCTPEEKVLVVGVGFDDNTFLAARNVTPARLVRAADVNPEQMLAFRKIIITQEALPTLAERTRK